MEERPDHLVAFHVDLRLKSPTAHGVGARQPAAGLRAGGNGGVTLIADLQAQGWAYVWPRRRLAKPQGDAI